MEKSSNSLADRYTAHRPHEYKLTEILANAITHGVGFLFAVFGTVYLLYQAAGGTALRTFCCALYSATLLCVYLFSTLYHSLTRTRARKVFQILDHSAIYLLIAGTYTPFSLLCMRGWIGLTIFISIWSCAIAGLVYKGVFGDRHPRVSLVIYLLMGWLGILAFSQFLHNVGWAGLAWVIAGGIFYTLGVYFYSRDHRPYYHALWHIFVMLGSLAHYLGVLLYALPAHT